MVAAEPTFQALDERGDAVDGEPSLLEVGRGSLFGREMQERELPKPDGVVGDDVGYRCLRELLAQRAQLFTGGLVFGAARRRHQRRGQWIRALPGRSLRQASKVCSR